MSDITWTNDRVRLGQLKRWERNPRRITKAQAQRLARSWQEFGQVQAVAVGPDNEVYDGHQRLSVLLALHGPDYEVDVRRASRALSDDERRALVLALHAGAVGAWDWDALFAWNSDMLRDWGFDGETLSVWREDVSALKEMLAGETIDFTPVSADAQHRIGQKRLCRCPQCGYEFQPED